jgi:hypothetical protein
MTVLELIANWTPEERVKMADLIAECLEREIVLKRLRTVMRGNENELTQGLDRLLFKIRRLADEVKNNGDQVQTLYLLLAKGKGNA